MFAQGSKEISSGWDPAKIKGIEKFFAAYWVVQKLLVGILVHDTSCLLKLLHSVFSQLLFKQPPSLP